MGQTGKPYKSICRLAIFSLASFIYCSTAFANSVVVDTADDLLLSSERIFYTEERVLTSPKEAYATAVASWSPDFSAIQEQPSIWSRVTFKTGVLNEPLWYIRFLGNIKYVEMHTFIDGELTDSIVTGDQFGYYHRPVDHPDLLLPVLLKNNVTVEILFLSHRQIDARTRFNLVERELFLLKDNSTKSHINFLLGALAVMVIYNFFIFLSVKDRSYLYYSLAMGFMFLGMAGMHRLNYKILWPDNPWIQANMMSIVMPMGLAFTTLFCMNFLQLRTFSKSLNIYCWGIIVAHLGTMIFSLIWFVPIYVVFPLIILTYSSFIYIGIYAWYRGVFSAPFFTVAWLSTAIAMVALALSVLVGQFGKEFSLNLLRALVAESLLLSFALGARIRLLKNMEIKEKGEFFSRVSHEMRTPLNGMLGSLSLIKASDISKPGLELLGYAKSSARQLNEIILDILDFTELTDGSKKLQSESINFREFIAGVYAYYEEVFNTKGILFCISVSPSIPSDLIFDAYRLRTILCVLLDNSNKFSQKGYAVVYITQLSTARDTIRLRFSIRDTGLGIEPDQLDRIFETFKQQESFFSRQHQGLGLGLSIAAENVALLGSKLKVKSTSGKGSRFYFDINMKIDASDTPLLDTKNFKPGTLSILYVEDNQINQMVTKKMLENFGHKVELAKNGEEGANKVINGKYDLVLMDCSMPIMDGFEATKAIRKAGLTTLPIIAVTANAMDGDKERCLKSGMDAYIAKPIKQDALLTTIYRTMTTRERKVS